MVLVDKYSDSRLFDKILFFFYNWTQNAKQYTDFE